MASAVVLLSGGMDSATCLALAVAAGLDCYSLSFNYGQRHVAELHAAERLAKELGAESHRELRIDLGALGGSALTDRELTIPETASLGIPITYVPARNTVFLSFALALAEVMEADYIYCGVNAVDYSGYPDCRPEFIDAFQSLARLATRRAVEGQAVELRTPLIDLSKAEIIRLGHDLGLNYASTVSCYQADPLGKACGRCDACRLRRSGFVSAGITDPTVYQKC